MCSIYILALVSMLPKVKDMINGVLGGENIEQKSLGDVYKDAKGAAGSGISSVAGLAKGIGGDAIKIGKPIGAVGRRISANMASKAAENKGKRESKFMENYAKKTGVKISDMTKEQKDNMQAAFDKKEKGRDVRNKVGGVLALGAATVLTGGVAAAAVGGGIIAKKGITAVGSALGKTTLGKSIGEAVFLGDNPVGKALRYHSDKEKNERLTKDEETLKGYTLAKYDAGTGIGVKQIGMAIEKERQAQDLLAKGPGTKEYAEGMRLQEEARKDAQKVGVTGSDFKKLLYADAKGDGSWLAMAQGMVKSDATAWRTDGTIYRAKDPMSTIRREMVENQINALPNTVKDKITNTTQFQNAVQANNPEAMAQALKDHVLGGLTGKNKDAVEAIAGALGRMGRGGTIGGDTIGKEMSALFGKTMDAHLEKDIAMRTELNTKHERNLGQVMEKVNQGLNNETFKGAGLTNVLTAFREEARGHRL